MTSFNFGANESKQQGLPFPEYKKEEKNAEEKRDPQSGKSSIEIDKSNGEIQVDIRPGNDKQGTEQPITLPDPGH